MIYFDLLTCTLNAKFSYNTIIANHTNHTFVLIQSHITQWKYITDYSSNCSRW